MDPADLYLRLLRQSLVGLLHPGPLRTAAPRFEDGGVDVVALDSEEPRLNGQEWPADAMTMVGVKRLDNVRRCVEDVLARRVPGDLIETGVWRGGTTIFMRGILAAHGDPDRRVWVADSFQGLPPPDPAYPADDGDRLHEFAYLAVSEEEVRENFARYELLDDRVRFVPGWFSETLPALPEARFAVVRLDGDMYESTMVALERLYPRLSIGGYLIVDDYGALATCSRAVNEYRERHGIDEEIVPVDWTGVFWRKERVAG